MTKLTQERLKELLEYNPDTGDFTRKSTVGGKVSGTVCGHRQPNEYVYIAIDYKLYLAHRLAWLYIHGEWPENDIDHINQVKYDNRRVNLRACTRSQNAVNRGIQSNNTSGYKGVFWHNKNKKWRATINHKGKLFSLGCFDDIKEAAKAWNVKALEIYGEFAVLNEIG